MLKFSSPLHEGKLIQRYKRFFADVELKNGELVTAHCANTGSMKGCAETGSTVYLSFHDSPTRKLKYGWEYTRTDDGLIGVNTSRPNLIVGEALKAKKVPALAEFSFVKGEAKFGTGTRFDFLLKKDEAAPVGCYVEVKNVSLCRDGVAQFPDAVTTRGQKHLHELIAAREAGIRAVMLFAINRPEATEFSPADDIDPEYGRILRVAKERGVEMFAHKINNTLEGSELGEAIPIKL
jgi:sugar fermentation stimulation protein A